MIIGIDASRANIKYKTGTEWYSYYLIKHFANLDSKNQYILYTNKPISGGLLDLTNFDVCDLDYDNENDVKFDKDGYQIIKSPHNNFKAKILNWPFSFFWTLGRLTIEMILNKPDVLFIPAHTMPLIFPKNTINTIHDIAFKKEKEIYRNKELSPIKKIFIDLFIKIGTFNKYSGASTDYLDWSTKFALKHAKKIITVSNATKQDIIKTYGDLIDPNYDKIYAIHNGFNKNLYTKITDQNKIDTVLNRYGIKKPYLLYVGRLEKKKNTPALIEAFAKVKYDFPEIKENLVLIGNAGFGYDEVKYNIAEFDMHSFIEIPGWVDECDMPYLYNGATAFIFPSKYEGFGIPILQAFGCEVPIISSSISAIKEVAGNASYYFNPYSINDMAKAIQKILSIKSLRRDLSQKGNILVEKYDWSICAKNTLEVINSLSPTNKKS